MLVLRVEVWPGGDRDRAQEIARVGIANTTGLRAVSDYSVVHLDEHGNRTNARVRAHRRGLGRCRSQSGHWPDSPANPSRP